MATCSRCAAHLTADAVACSFCGLAVGGEPAAPASVVPLEAASAVPPEPAPSSTQPPTAAEGSSPPVPPSWVPCWRCGAPLYPGFRLCPNCGLETSFSGGPRRKSRLPLIVGLMVVVVLATAGALLVFYHGGNGWDPGAEASPPGSWQAFTAPDGSWTMTFPGPLAPMKLSQNMEAAGYSMQMTMFVASNGGAAYEAATLDLPSYVAASLSNESLQDDVASQMFGPLGGEVKASRTVTFDGHTAREVKLSVSKAEGYCRFFLVGDRMYVLMVLGPSGTTLYPEHFFDSLHIK